MRELWQSIVRTSLTQIYSLCLGMVSIAITARWLGPEGRGIVATAATWVGLFNAIGYFSLGQVALHHAATQKGMAWLGPVMGSLLSITLFVALMGWLCAGILYRVTHGAFFGHLAPSVLFLALLGLPLATWENYGSHLLMSVNRLSIYNRAQVVGRTATLLLVVLFILGFGWSYYGAIGATLVGQFIIATAGIRALLASSETRVLPQVGTIRLLLKGGLQFHLHSIGMYLMSSTDILVIHHYLGSAQTGIYQLAVQLIGTLLIVPQAACMVMYSKVAAMGADAAWRLQKGVLKKLLVFMALVALAAAVMAPVLIPLVAGQRFEASTGVFQVLLFTLLSQTLQVVMMPQWVGRGLFWQASALSLLIGLLNLLANIWLVPRYGIFGSAWATIGSLVVQAASQLWMARWINRTAVPCPGGAPEQVAGYGTARESVE